MRVADIAAVTRRDEGARFGSDRAGFRPGLNEVTIGIEGDGLAVGRGRTGRGCRKALGHVVRQVREIIRHDTLHPASRWSGTKIFFKLFKYRCFFICY